jgi:hypothetical protein
VGRRLKEEASGFWHRSHHAVAVGENGARWARWRN